MPYSKLTYEEALDFLTVMRWRTGDMWEKYMMKIFILDVSVYPTLSELTNEIIGPHEIISFVEVSERDQVAVDVNLKAFTSRYGAFAESEVLLSSLASIPNMYSSSTLTQQQLLTIRVAMFYKLGGRIFFEFYLNGIETTSGLTSVELILLD